NGTSATTTQTVEKGANATLSVDTFTKEGYVISSWNTKPDGSGTSYANLSSISPSENITLYAQWQPVFYDFTASISYEGSSPGAYYELIIIATTDQNFEPTVDNDDYGSSFYSYVLNNTYDNKVSRERSIEWKLTIEYKIHIFTPYYSISSGVANSVKSITPTPSNTTISSLNGLYVSFAMTNDNLRLDIMGDYRFGYPGQ
ncbi:MAG: InlB B-repeat-containing protein, partial [Clostridia bacterium]|nr:InlB B-repeat-containing protein [Clostridia bacterium]